MLRSLMLLTGTTLSARLREASFRPEHFRKRTILPLLFAISVHQSQAGDSAYRTALNAAHERYRALEMQLHDFRKIKPELPPTQREERLRLLGQLVTDDPVWVLAEQIHSDIAALVAIRSRTAADDAILDSLKDFLAITSGFQERATARKQAELFSTALRQFIARRDAAGASAWAQSQ